MTSSQSVNVNIQASSSDSVGRVEVSGGRLAVSDSAAYLFLNNVGTPGTLDFLLSAGEVNLTGSKGLALYRGEVTATVSGGTLTAPYIYLGFNSGDPVLQQTGGTISADGIVLAQKNAVGGTLVLDGGLTSVGSVAKGSGSGAAKLSANGGTLQAKAANASFVKGLDVAELGSEGLTIDVQRYSVTVPQAFRDANGSRGRLVKIGSGALTLSAVGSVPSEIVAAAGSLVFASGANVGTKLVVTNDASVSLGGNTAATPLTGLVIGNATGSGRLVLAKGETVAVSGPIELADVALTLSGDWQIGETATLLTSTATVSVAGRRAWERASISADVTAGRSFRLSVEADGDGGTLFKVGIGESATVEMRLEASGMVSNATESVNGGAADSLSVAVAADSTINASGRYAVGSLVKDGIGTLSLSDPANNFWSVTLNAGTLAVSPLSAIGLGMDDALAFNGGRLFVSGCAAVAEFGTTVATGERTAYVLQNDDALTMPLPTLTSGDLVKRGAGTLTYLVSGTGGKLSRDDGVQPNGKTAPATTPVKFGADGVPVDGYAGLNVVEGLLHVKGRGADVSSVELKNLVYVGLSVPEVAAQPGLVFEDVNVEPNNGGQAIDLGGGATAGNSGVLSPSFAMTNATLGTVPIFRVGEGSTVALEPNVSVDGSTLATINYYPNNCMTAGSVAHHRFTRGSSLSARTALSLNGKSELVFDASTLSGENGAPVPLAFGSVRSETSFVFVNGARLVYGHVLAKQPKALSFAFDGSSWDLPSGTSACTNYGNVIVSSVGAGLILQPAVTDDWTFGQKIDCEAPVTVSGEGVARFVSEGADGLVLTGSGTVKNSDLRNVRLMVSDLAHASDVLTFDGCSFDGTVRVDFGRTPENPVSVPFAGIPVARFAGSVPNVSRWRLVGTGLSGVRGRFEVDADGLMTVSSAPPPGIMLIVR